MAGGPGKGSPKHPNLQIDPVEDALFRADTIDRGAKISGLVRGTIRNLNEPPQTPKVVDQSAPMEDISRAAAATNYPEATLVGLTAVEASGKDLTSWSKASGQFQQRDGHFYDAV